MCLCKFLFNQHYNKPHFMRKLYLHKGREDLVTGCNVFVLLQDRWLWCHSSKWFMKHKNLIIMSSKIYCMHPQGIDIQLDMAKVRRYKYLCDMHLLKGDIVFEINILSIPTHLHCMTLGLCCFHQQVDTCQSTMMELLDLGCSFLLESYYHLGLSL